MERVMLFCQEKLFQKRQSDIHVRFLWDTRLAIGISWKKIAFELIKGHFMDRMSFISYLIR